MALTRAVSSLGAPGLGLEEFCALAGRFGLGAIELRSLGSELHLPRYFAGTYATPDRVQQVLSSLKMRVPAMGTSFKLCGAGDEDRAALLEFVPWAEATGTPYLRVFDGGVDTSQEEFAQRVEALDWWRTLKDKNGWKVDVIVETHDSLLTAEAVLRLLQLVPGTRILWDAHHTWKKGGESPALTWSRIGEHVAHIHVKDSVSLPSLHLPYTYVPPGTGEFPMAEVLQALEGGYSGALCLEWEKLWHPELPELEVALAAARQRRWW